MKNVMIFSGFFLLIFLINLLLDNTIKYLFIFIVTLGLTIYVYYNISISNNKTKASVINAVTLFILVELSKVVQFASGNLPRYLEQPLISAFGVLILIILYITLIYGLNTLFHKTSKSNDSSRSL